MTCIEALARDRHFDRQFDLVRQHWAAARHLWLDAPDLSGAGKLRAALPRDFWIGCGMPGLATVKLTGAGRFAFADSGLTAVIIPAYDTIAGLLDASAEAHVEHLVDLVAVDVDRPDRFWRRRGEAVVLGAAFLEIADHESAPIPVFKNPMTWLRSGGAGVVVLDWTWARNLLLGLEIVAEDLGLGERLEAALRPNILIGRAVA